MEQPKNDNYRNDYRNIIDLTMKRKAFSTAEVSKNIGVSVRHLNGIRSGHRPLYDDILEKLIVELELDKNRLYFAIHHMKDPMLYFDASFKNCCSFSILTLDQSVSLSQSIQDTMEGDIFKSTNKKGLKHIAQENSNLLHSRLTEAAKKIYAN
jgi:hypothetical protein